MQPLARGLGHDFDPGLQRVVRVEQQQVGLTPAEQLLEKSGEDLPHVAKVSRNRRLIVRSTSTMIFCRDSLAWLRSSLCLRRNSYRSRTPSYSAMAPGLTGPRARISARRRLDLGRRLVPVQIPVRFQELLPGRDRIPEGDAPDTSRPGHAIHRGTTRTGGPVRPGRAAPVASRASGSPSFAGLVAPRPGPPLSRPTLPPPHPWRALVPRSS